MRLMEEIPLIAVDYESRAGMDALGWAAMERILKYDEEHFDNSRAKQQKVYELK